ncbi:MAG: tyrosine recombinase XerC [Oscillospiraceae bacterium]|nr:tyrosine recombinase XerC [Oscillospiraceae bacterium]
MSDKGFPDYLIEYVYYLRDIRGRSEHTITGYTTDLMLFFRFLYEDKIGGDGDVRDLPFETVAAVTLRDVYAFLSWSGTVQGNNDRTRSRKVSSLRGFYSALAQGKIISYSIARDPVANLEKPKLKKVQPKYLALDDSKRLVGHLDPEDKFYRRDFCILMLFLNCGMRLSELVGMNLNDVNFEDRSIRLLGKGNKERIIHMNEGCAEAITDYLGVRPICDEKALFLSNRKTRITGRRVEQIVTRAIQQIGLEGRGLSAHKLRHTAATLMYQYGNVDPIVLKEILGHQSVSTTEIYTHLTNENVRTALDANPMSDVHGKG